MGLFDKGTNIQAPDPVNPGQAQGEYLFGKEFGDAQGVTDPRLQQRLISAERTFRPQYTALELADIGTFARGIGAGQANPEYARIQSQLASLRAGDSATEGALSREEITSKANDLYPITKGGGFKPLAPGIQARNEKNKKLQDDYIERELKGASGQNAGKIAELETQLANTPQTLEGTPGLFDLLEESSERAFDLQTEQLGQQRAADVAALQKFAPRVVEAYREADPFSTELAGLASDQARTLFGEAEGQLSPERRRMAEQAARAGSLSRGRIGDESSIASELLGREQIRSGLRAEARQAGAGAFGMNRALAGDAGNIILGRPSAAIGLGQQTLGQAQQGAAGQMGPQLFDANVGYNAALQQQANEFGLLGAQAQADAASSAGGLGAFGSIVGGFLGGRK